MKNSQNSVNYKKCAGKRKISLSLFKRGMICCNEFLEHGTMYYCVCNGTVLMTGYSVHFINVCVMELN